MTWINLIPLFIAVVSVSHALVYRRGKCVAALAIVATGISYIVFQLQWINNNTHTLLQNNENVTWAIIEMAFFVTLLICQREMRNPKCLSNTPK
jgi:hypothetical protein